MATYYLDTVGGNDSNDGTSFANRKLTLAAFTGLSPGDTIRVMGTAPAAESPSVNFSATTGNTYLTTASTVAIDLWASSISSGNWTSNHSSTTCSLDTSDFKEGTYSQLFTIVNPPTTGTSGSPILLAYFNFPSTINCSAYNFSVATIKTDTYISAASAGNGFSLACSSNLNGASAVGVNQMSFANNGVEANNWATSLSGSQTMPSSCKSLALLAGGNLSGTATYNLRLNNFHAGKWSVGRLFGMNDNLWYPYRSLTGGNTINFDAGANSLGSSAGRPWQQSNQSSTALWILNRTFAVAINSSSGTIAQSYAGGSGTSGSPITISGGWDSTSMSTQNASTVLSGRTGQPGCIGMDSGGYSNIVLDHVVFWGFATGLQMGSSDNWNLTNCSFPQCDSSITRTPSACSSTSALVKTPGFTRSVSSPSALANKNQTRASRAVSTGSSLLNRNSVGASHAVSSGSSLAAHNIAELIRSLASASALSIAAAKLAHLTVAVASASTLALQNAVAVLRSVSSPSILVLHNFAQITKALTSSTSALIHNLVLSTKLISSSSSMFIRNAASLARLVSSASALKAQNNVTATKLVSTISASTFKNTASVVKSLTSATASKFMNTVNIVCALTSAAVVQILTGGGLTNLTVAVTSASSLALENVAEISRLITSASTLHLQNAAHSFKLLGSVTASAFQNTIQGIRSVSSASALMKLLGFSRLCSSASSLRLSNFASVARAASSNSSVAFHNLVEAVKAVTSTSVLQIIEKLVLLLTVSVASASVLHQGLSGSVNRALISTTVLLQQHAANCIKSVGSSSTLSRIAGIQKSALATSASSLRLFFGGLFTITVSVASTSALALSKLASSTKSLSAATIVAALKNVGKFAIATSASTLQLVSGTLQILTILVSTASALALHKSVGSVKAVVSPSLLATSKAISVVRSVVSSSLLSTIRLVSKYLHLASTSALAGLKQPAKTAIIACGSALQMTLSAISTLVLTVISVTETAIKRYVSKTTLLNTASTLNLSKFASTTIKLVSATALRIGLLLLSELIPNTLYYYLATRAKYLYTVVRDKYLYIAKRKN